MSALAPKADMCAATRDVCFGPKADIRVCGDTFLLRISDEHGSAWQNDRDFGELTRLRIDLD
jgi:hypothetical protein